MKKKSTLQNLAILGVLAINATTLTSCGKGQTSVPGMNNFSTAVLNGSLYVSFVSTTLHLDAGATIQVPQLADATMSVSPDIATNGTVFQFSVGLAALVNQGKALPLEGLPDGQPLPDVTGGVLPRWDFTIAKLNISAYLSSDAFGLFIPLSFLDLKGIPLLIQVSQNITDAKGNLLGRAYAIPSNVSGAESGLFILLPYLGSAPVGSSPPK